MEDSRDANDKLSEDEVLLVRIGPPPIIYDHSYGDPDSTTVGIFLLDHIDTMPLVYEMRRLIEEAVIYVGIQGWPPPELGIAYGDVIEWWQATIMSAPAWAALASVFKTFLTRRNGRRIIIYGEDGGKILEVAET